MRSMTERTILACALVMGMCLVAQPANAQGFISPLVGFNFGDDAPCISVTDCDDKNLNLGVSFGALGSIFGFEEEIAYAQDFFGETPDGSSNVLTVMSNVMIAPDLKAVWPYVLGGLGLIKSHAELNSASLFSSDNNALGWDFGGGLMIFFGSHFGLRGDIRYFHAFQDLEFTDLALSGTKLDFGRASAAVVFKF